MQLRSRSPKVRYAAPVSAAGGGVSEASEKSARHGHLRRLASVIGPGVITGAADDDPSGIATYSITGAALGTSLLWTALLTWPLMAAVQMMCARIGMVTGRGLAAALRTRFPRPLVAIAALVLLAANTVNIGADLAGMADAAEMLTRVNSHFWVFAFGVGIAAATVWLRYAQIANTLKWLALFLSAYVIAALSLHPDWSAVARATFIPHWPASRLEWSNLVAILGTTISPYLFFWQASQEVEEEKAGGRLTLAQRKGATGQEILLRKADVAAGTFFSNLVMFFIILTTALTLHRNGIRDIETSRQAAEALRPIAGAACTFLYTIGIIGVGLLAIPTLAGSAAYALAETFAWRQGLDMKLARARAFYAVVLLSIAVGAGVDFMQFSAVKALYYSAVLNGMLAPVLLAGILVVASDATTMLNQPSSLLGRATVAGTTLLMAFAAVAMFVV
jgi:Mn2+/Fe2+ NRAMP family transporter